jgi:hypothetical protein
VSGFEISPQLKSGKHSAPLLERLAYALRPKLKIGKKLFWGDIDKKRLSTLPTLWRRL